MLDPNLYRKTYSIFSLGPAEQADGNSLLERGWIKPTPSWRPWSLLQAIGERHTRQAQRIFAFV
jgi:hypothetical protein